MDMPALKAAGLGVSDLAQHSTYMQEFMWEVLADGDHDARALTVMDVGGLSLRRLSHPDTAELIRTTSGVLDAHYPNRVTRILVVNAPKWLASAWSLLVKLLPPTLRDRVRVLKTLVELHEHIDPACLPLAYGGTDATPPGESAEERLLLEIVTGVRAGRLPPAVAALHDRRRAAEKKEALDGGVLPSVGPTAAGENELQQQEEEQEAPSLLDTPASSVFTTTTSSGGSPVAFPETAQVAWAAAEGEKPQPLPSPPAAAALLTTPAAHPSAHFVRLSWRGRKSKDGEAAVVGTERPRPLSFTFSSCPLEPPNAREGKVTLPSSSQPPLPPHSAGFTGGSKAFWRRRGRFRAPRAAEASSARVVVPTPSAS